MYIYIYNLRLFNRRINFHRLRYPFPSERRPSTVSLCSIMKKKKTARGGPSNQLSMRFYGLREG